MGNSCLTDPNGVITMKVMDFYDLIDVVSKKIRSGDRENPCRQLLLC